MRKNIAQTETVGWEQHQEGREQGIEYSFSKRGKDTFPKIKLPESFIFREVCENGAM
jgi:hypothetical protein